ncbi:alpha-lactalbumin isoform X1 [Trachypithecus francoisi]|uniref:alpha-lactalbumin isoform X1 n=1 Tax=Trachypithecus francoisi TaxID=54180 RepID=UPI00141ACB7F|nr:alpha-lactalbumin isoform X1 [Trachypithecus francoisi]
MEKTFDYRFLVAAKMRSFVPLFLVGILFPAIPAKQFTKCELSQLLKDIDGYGGIALPERWPIKPSALRSWNSGFVRSCEHLLSLAPLPTPHSWSASSLTPPQFAAFCSPKVYLSLSLGHCSDITELLRTIFRKCMSGALSSRPLLSAPDGAFTTAQISLLS